MLMNPPCAAGATLYFRSKKQLFAEWFKGKATRRTLISGLCARRRCLVSNQNRRLASALTRERGRFEYASQFKILCRTREHERRPRRAQLTSSCALIGDCRRCRGAAPCYFQIAAGPPAVFSKRFVFELIEDEDGLVMARRCPLHLRIRACPGSVGMSV